MNIRSLFMSSKEKFWIWFQDNEEMLFNLESNRDAIFNKLSQQLMKVDKGLKFEFSSVSKTGTRDFVISADGIIKVFPLVVALYECAPNLERWRIIKFRPRKDVISAITIGNKCVKSEDVYYRIFEEEEPNKIAIMLFINGYTQEERDIWDQVGFIFLDGLLGEFDVETKIGGLAFEAIDSIHFEDARPIKELAKEFDQFFS